MAEWKSILVWPSAGTGGPGRVNWGLDDHTSQTRPVTTNKWSFFPQLQNMFSSVILYWNTIAWQHSGALTNTQPQYLMCFHLYPFLYLYKEFWWGAIPMLGRQSDSALWPDSWEGHWSAACVCPGEIKKGSKIITLHGVKLSGHKSRYWFSCIVYLTK